MRDWSIKSKENSEEYRNSGYKEQPLLPLGLRQSTQRRGFNLVCWRGHHVAHWMAEKLLWSFAGRTCWKSVLCGKLFRGKHSSGGALLQNCPQQVLEGKLLVSALLELCTGETVHTAGISSCEKLRVLQESEEQANQNQEAKLFLYCLSSMLYWQSFRWQRKNI